MSYSKPKEAAHPVDVEGAREGKLLAQGNACWYLRAMLIVASVNYYSVCI